MMDECTIGTHQNNFLSNSAEMLNALLLIGSPPCVFCVSGCGFKGVWALRESADRSGAADPCVSELLRFAPTSSAVDAHTRPPQPPPPPPAARRSSLRPGAMGGTAAAAALRDPPS